MADQRAARTVCATCRGTAELTVECGECSLLHVVPCPDCTGIVGVVGRTLARG